MTPEKHPAMIEVARAAERRRAAESARREAVAALHAAIRAAAAERWRAKEIALVAGISNITAHKLIAEQGTRP